MEWCDINTVMTETNQRFVLHYYFWQWKWFKNLIYVFCHNIKQKHFLKNKYDLLFESVNKNIFCVHRTTIFLNTNYFTSYTFYIIQDSGHEWKKVNCNTYQVLCIKKYIFNFWIVSVNFDHLVFAARSCQSQYRFP